MMDSCIGLDYIVENPDYVSKLAAALDTNNVVVKKQVFELLSALCVYSQEGHARAMDALDKYKELQGERYRLRVVVKELTAHDTSPDYKKALIAFINCVLVSTPQLNDRIKIRNEFIGLKLLPALNDIRREGATAPEVVLQLDVFDEQREADEAQVLQGPNGVDLSSHLDVFYAILRQIADTPQEIPFLSILQHLLRVDPKEVLSDIVWDTAETLVHRATLLENRQDASKLLRSPSVQGKLNCHCNCYGYRGGSDGRKQSLITAATSPPPPPVLPPPPPPPCLPPPPPPPPPLPLVHTKMAPPGSPSSNGSLIGGPPRPPPLLEAPDSPTNATEDNVDSTNGKLLPQQATPTPKAKMKTINWNKIPNNKVVGKHNIWSLVARSHQNAPMPELDWAEMEGLFCQQTPAAAALPPLTASPRLTRDNHDVERKRKESSEIALLDGKRSLNVNIFLKQFRSSNEDIIQMIREGGHDDIGAEKLRGLLKMLPEIDELEMLRAFDGDITKLGNAEKFLLQLIQVPNYKLRIESMLLKEEFAANMGYLEPSINAMIVAGEELMTNKQLQEVLYMVVVAGNFLNFGGYAGNAAGVKLSSLQKLTDIRANKPGMNLIHYVAMQAEKSRKDLLLFPDDLSVLDDATKTTTEQLQNEINVLDSRIKKVWKQIELPSTEPEIKVQMVDFLMMAEQEVTGLQKDMDELEAVRKALSDFFCEDSGTFKLEECFKILHGFCTKFRQAVQENERRRIQEEQTYLRRKLREDQAAKKRQLSTAGSEMEYASSEFVPRSSIERDAKVRKYQNGASCDEDAASSPALSRRRMGSFSGPPDELPAQDSFSPDVTPTGSLRRRRSRVPSEEDDSNLMDFLRASGQDVVGREKKSWGSLDRSWARRAKGSGSSRKRPDLLSADFCGGRERPTSPTPLAENRTILHPPEPDEKPKAWKTKIEAWLIENEKEDDEAMKTDEIRKRTRRLHSVNRRSLETDSESENRSGTLVTLSEELKPEPQPAIPTEYKRVYPDWKPAIDKTDVVGAMEAIEGAHTENTGKDKSVWRKSNLNLADSTKGEDDPRRLRRLRSRNSMEQITPPLRAIKEEERKKSLISTLSAAATEDKLTLYLRRPSGDDSPLLRGGSLRNPRRPETIVPPSLPRRLHRQDQVISDKIEIDSDNIETPPVTRRKFTKLHEEPRKSTEAKTYIELHRTSPEGRSDKENEKNSLLRNSDRLREIAQRGDQDEVLGDGQFDRFSSARRTRRYKKNHDSDAADDKETYCSTAVPAEIITETVPTRKIQSELVETCDDKQARLKAWQDRLKYHGTPLINEGARVAQLAITDINKVGAELKNISNEGQAIISKPSTLPRLVSQNSRKEVPKKDDCARKDRALTVNEPKQLNDVLKKTKRASGESLQSHQSKNDDKVKAGHLKGKHEHDLNDEGFEETQSLGSETPSQGTLSGNFDSIELSVVDGETKRGNTLVRVDSGGSGDTNPPPTKVVRGVTIKEKVPSYSKIPSQVPIKIESSTILNRSHSVRAPKSSYGIENKRFLPLKRSTSLKKTDSQSSIGGSKISNGVKRRGIERSNSKTSLRSSRSSLNSATSVNTVKNVPLVDKSSPTSFTKITAKYTSAIKNLTSDLNKVPTKINTERAPSRNGSIQAEQKRPFSQVQTRSTGEKSSVPASRSSSSGSSIGPSARRPRMSPHLSTSFKENVVRVRTSPSPVVVADSKPKLNKPLNSVKSTEQASSPVQQSRVGLSFMRPTASSTAKDLEIPTPKLRSVPKRFLK